MTEYDWRKIDLGIIVLIVILALIVCGVFFAVSKFKEDSWIKDSKGLYVMHGNPDSVPDDVKVQQNALGCAGELYVAEGLKYVNFSSQCLGTCGNYAVDIVHVPRTSEDDLKENQCSDYLDGKVKHFIELNSQGQVVRIE